MTMVAGDDVVLAVDCGSTNMKVGLYDRSLNRLGSATTAVQYSRHDEGWVELEGETLWDRFVELVNRVCEQTGVSADTVNRVAFGSQAQTFCVADSTGTLRTPFYSWLDSRAGVEADIIRREFGPCFHTHCSFSPPVAQLQLCKMLWLRRHQPFVFDGDARVVMLPELLAWRLGGGWVTDRNLAAMGGAYSLASGSWWAPALRLCGLSADTMPDLVDVGATTAVRRESMLAALAPRLITYAGNDQTVGAYGNGCDERSILVTLGTALVVYRVTGTSPGPYHSGSFWGPYPGGRYYELATLDEGCQALDWAIKTIIPDGSPAAFDALAQATIDAGEQSKAPLFRPQFMGHDTAWSSTAGPHLMAYSVLEGIAFALRRLLEDVFQLQVVPALTVVGGGSKSDVWLGILSDVMSCSVSRGTGDALVGAAALALGVDPPDVRQPTSVAKASADHVAALTERYRVWCSP